MAQQPDTPGEATGRWTRPAPSFKGVRAEKYWQREGAVEVVVDDPGELYRRRRYQGVIPFVRDQIRRHKKSSKVTHVGRINVTWVGFQQRAQTSRVFIQTDRVAPYRPPFQPDPLHIVVEFPNARIPKRNDRRFVLTHEFNSNVRYVKARQAKRDLVEVIVSLKAPVGYFHKQEGAYLFIDVAR